MTPAIVLGLGGTVDYELAWDATVLSRQAQAHRIRRDELNQSIPITDERSLLISVLSLMATGTGSEEFAATPEIIERFAEHFSYRVTLGGTCVRAALALAHLEIPSLVHLVSMNDTVRALLPTLVQSVCSATEDSVEPHLIVQYPQGAEVTLTDSTIVAPQANRLIYVNDQPNRDLRLSADLDPAVANADVFLISGFNTMQDEILLTQRVNHLQQLVAGMKESAVRMYEDAGYHRPDFAARVRDALAGAVDVYSLNEEELRAYLSADCDVTDPNATWGYLQRAHALIPARCLVVHTQYWAAAIGTEAHRYRAALHSGVAMSGARYLYGDAVTTKHYRELQSQPASAEAIAFARELERLSDGAVVCSPAYRLQSKNPTTIGLGDSFVGGFLAELLPKTVPFPVQKF